MTEARLFPSACVASPHYLASAAGLAVLASGGNALDAAVATNLTLGVVTPYLCGYGGDLFALVWTDGVAAYEGAGRAPAASTPEAVRAAVGSPSLPARGPHTVTVPGAVEGWFSLLERFGTRSFGDLSRPAVRYAREGFALTERATQTLAAAREALGRSESWAAVYGEAPERRFLRQPDLARAIETLAAEGPDAYYRGPIGAAIVEHLGSLGALLKGEDLAAHGGGWVEPLGTTYRGVEVLEMPPPTQGVAVLEALNVLEVLGPLPPPGPERDHLLIEATKLALADRDAHVTDPEDMVAAPAGSLADPAWAEQRSREVDPTRAGRPGPGRVAVGGTAYLCAADDSGMCVSLIQSNYMGFGSGVTVPGWGINLQNRGAYFSLREGDANVIAPRKRTLHTLIPALALRGGRPWLVFGSMGGDAQAQIHVQVLARMVDDGDDPQRAIGAPRWVVSPADWSVAAEERFPPEWLVALRERGHDVRTTGPFDSLMGHAHAIRVDPTGYAGATDPRAEGAVLGL